MKMQLIKFMVLGAMLVGLPLVSQAASAQEAIISARASALVSNAYTAFTISKARGQSTANAQAAALAKFKAAALSLANTLKGTGSEATGGQAIAQALSEALSKGYLSGDGVSEIIAAIKAADAKVYAAMQTSGQSANNLASFFPKNDQNDSNTYTPPGSGSTSVNVAATTSVSDGQAK